MDKLKQFEVYVEELILAIDENTEYIEHNGFSTPIVPLQYVADELDILRKLNKGG